PSNMPRGEESGGKPENTDHGASGEDAADLWEDAAPDGTEDAANADGMDAVPGDPLADNIVVSEALDQSLLKAAGVKTATPSDMEKESVVKILDMPAFAASKVVDGVRITVTAEEGTFPEGAVLVAEKVPTAKEREAEAAVAEQREENQNVVVSYTFDIRVEDAEGNELQPEDGHAVQVSFSTAEIADGNLETNVYHITEEGGSASADSEEAVVSEAGETAEAGNENENAGGTDDTDASAGTLTAEKLEVTVDESTETAVADTDGFSLYTVEFTYNSLQYVMPGGTEVRLAEILNTVGLSGEATAVEVSNASLFSASNGSGEWVITSHEPFSSTEWMKVTINGIVYEITVTDANVNVNVSVNSWADLQAAFTADNNVILTADVTAAASDERLSIPAGVNITLDLNGYTINRNRTQQESNGHVISLYGKLTLKDSSSGQTGKITGGNNYSSQGGAIVVFDGGKLIMEGGMISGNEASQLNNAGQGGGVCVMSGGSFTMSGGSIEDNIAGFGGGVYVASGATFTMSGGNISNNRANRETNFNSSGGGVYLDGSFTMSSGTISGNIAGTFGGGIDMGHSAGIIFTMSGGNITDNTAYSSGGGIACDTNTTTTIMGGSITNNNGGGINARGTFNLQGNPTISGNKSGSYDSNLYAATTIHITGVLINSTPIGVTTETTPTIENGGVYFTDGLQSPGKADYTKFKSDSEKYYMGEDDTGSGKEAKLYANYEIYVSCSAGNDLSRFTPETPYRQYVRPGSAMTAAVFTAKTNYGFPTGYSVSPVSGISVARTSQTQVTLTGTPTGNTARIEIVLEPAVSLYNVRITAESNMTRTGGAASQTVASGDAITSVVYTANIMKKNVTVSGITASNKVYDGGSGNGIAERTIYPNAQYSSTDGGSWHQNGTEWTFTFADGRSAAEEWVYATYLGIRNWYYFGGDGRMRTGWLTLGDSIYYLNPVSDGTKGRMLTGWAMIDGKWYYFETQAGRNQGRMYRNEMTPDGYRVGPDGVWIP
ncbi:MAG: hypothetical protein IJ061_07545, partial [Lachnospiraceae bacterium]|nr:hypothetical protein [Lachnospiraceae bacterium]